MTRDAFPGADAHRFDGETPTQLELDRLVAQAQAVFAWRAEVDGLEAQGEVEGVTVTVDGNGNVRAIVVSDDACGDGGKRVAARVAAAAHEAHRLLGEQIRASAEAAFGAGSPVLRSVEGGIERRFSHPAGVLPEEEAKEAGPAGPTW
ncbi:MAG: hypothetical protein LWW86_16475 [Micrococcales bacterium]|nr:hypothetical protein [Micrococcales bacterium]